MTVVLLDMDGPLAGFDQKFWANPRLRGLLSIDRYEQQTSWFFTDFIRSDRVRDSVRRMLNAPGWYRDLPVVDGAVEGVDALEAAGIDVWVCTRPHPDSPTCVSEKQAWLREHFPMLDGKLITVADKSMVGGDVLLDDAPPFDTRMTPTWRPVVFTAPYNGVGSKWGNLPSWSWGDPIERLVG